MNERNEVPFQAKLHQTGHANKFKREVSSNSLPIINTQIQLHPGT